MIALTGAVLAGRALLRSGADRVGPVVPLHEDPAIISALAELAAAEERFLTYSRDELPVVLDDIRQRAVSLVNNNEVSDITSAQAVDLGNAVHARFARLFGLDFDANLADLRARGWNVPDTGTLQRLRDYWERHEQNARVPPMLTEGVMVRELPRHVLEQPGGLRRAGYRLSELAYNAGVAPADLSRDDARLIEVLMPIQIEDVKDRGFPALVGFVFLWDDQLGVWCPLRSLVHVADPDAGGIAVHGLL